MPDIDALFLQLIEEKGPIYVAAQLEHKNTAIVDRWTRDKKVPDLRKFQVMELLKSEDLLS